VSNDTPVIRRRVRLVPPRDDTVAQAGVDAEAVGYCRPPTHSRFKQGQSGNPRGRPKGSRSLAAIIQDELSTKATVRDGGRERRLAKRQIVARRLVNSAVGGDLKSIDKLVKLDEGPLHQRGHRRAGADAMPASVEVTEGDRDILAEFMAMARDALGAGATYEQ
jgi:hypothetical protein